MREEKQKNYGKSESEDKEKKNKKEIEKIEN